jgi:hypothetical protein
MREIVNEKFGTFSVYMFVILPKRMQGGREKRVTLASIPAYESECRELFADFKEANPEIASLVHGRWTSTETVLY